MISKLLKLKKNKLLFSLVLFVAVTVIFDLLMILFNIIQVAVMFGNSASMTGLMMPLNIISICLSGLSILLVVAYLIFNKLKK